MPPTCTTHQHDQFLVGIDQLVVPQAAIDAPVSPSLPLPPTTPPRHLSPPGESSRGPVQWADQPFFPPPTQLLSTPYLPYRGLTPNPDQRSEPTTPLRTAMTTPITTPQAGVPMGTPIRPILLTSPSPGSLPLPTVEVAQPQLPPPQPDPLPPASGPLPSTYATRSSTRSTMRPDYAQLHATGTRTALVAQHLVEAKDKLKRTLASFDKYTHRRNMEPELGPFAGLSTTLKKALREHPDAVITAVQTEFHNLVTLKQCIRPVDYATLTSAQRHKILYSFMFLTEKYTSTGEFDKLKARLAEGGDMQDTPAMTVDPPAPTVDFLTVQVILNLIALQRMHSAVLDVTAAFLNADLDEEAFITLDAPTAQLFIKQFPQFKKWIRSNGTLICLVLKALYGMIQSAKLWYTIFAPLLSLWDLLQ